MALVSEGLSPTVEPWSSLGYLHRPSTEDEVKGITHWVVTDLDTQVRHALLIPRLGRKNFMLRNLCAGAD